MQYIIGEWDFRYLTLSMKQPVFIPRPETEVSYKKIAKALSSTFPSKIFLFSFNISILTFQD